MYTLTEYSYRSADSIITEAAGFKTEIRSAIEKLGGCAGPAANEELAVKVKEGLIEAGWQELPSAFFLLDDPPCRFKLLKERTAVIVEFGEPAYFGMDMLRFQLYSPSDRNRIDAGIYIVATRGLEETLLRTPGSGWVHSLTFERVREYLPYFRSVIQVPICVLGLGLGSA